MDDVDIAPTNPNLCAHTEDRSIAAGVNYGFQNMNEPTSSLVNRHDEDALGARSKRQKRDIHGWLVLDKPVGMTSTHAVSIIKHLFAARRAGHAGTLDPLASGCLPIALGEATKTVPFVFDGRKTYRFTIPGQIVGALASQFHGGEARRYLLDRAGKARQ